MNKDQPRPLGDERTRLHVEQPPGEELPGQERVYDPDSDAERDAEQGGKPVSSKPRQGSHFDPLFLLVQPQVASGQQGVAGGQLVVDRNPQRLEILLRAHPNNSGFVLIGGAKVRGDSMAVGNIAALTPDQGFPLGPGDMVIVDTTYGAVYAVAESGKGAQGLFYHESSQ